MKIAQLPNGHQISFPPETPDAEMDAHVQRYLGAGGAAPGGASLLPAMMQAFQQYMMEMEQGKSAQSDEKSAMEMQMRAADTERAVQAIGTLIQAMQKALGPLAQIGASATLTPRLIKSIDNLAQVVANSAGEIARVMQLPKQIVDGAQGEPRMIATVGQPQNRV